MLTKIGEVIESSTNEFTAECYELYNLPAFGSMVKIVAEPTQIYGIVYLATTASVEPGRRPVARGKDEVSEEAVYQSSPQLTKLLRSEVRISIIGFKEENRIRQYLPPVPARIHSFVYPCTPDEIKEFSSSFDFLTILINNRLPIASEELIGAALREMSKVQENPHAFLIAAGKSLTSVLSGEYNRLKTILTRLKQ